MNESFNQKPYSNWHLPIPNMPSLNSKGTRPHDSTELFYWSAATISLIMCQSRALFSFVVLNFQSACGYAKFISKFILKRKKEGFFFPTMFNNYLYVSWTLCWSVLICVCTWIAYTSTEKELVWQRLRSSNNVYMLLKRSHAKWFDNFSGFAFWTSST